MNYPDLTCEQGIQEEEYQFPYHYLDLMPRFAYMCLTDNSYRRCVMERIAPFEGQRVLDAGCGDGRLAYELGKKKLKVSGVDYSERAIAFARVFCPDAEFTVCDLTSGHPDGKYDVILLVEVLEHFEPAKVDQVLGQLNECLAEGGKVIVTVPSKKSKLIGKHYQHFTPDELEACLGRHFTVVSMDGHLRCGFRYGLYRVLLRSSYILGPLRVRMRVVQGYFDLIERLLRSIEKCSVDKAARLVAVCRKL